MTDLPLVALGLVWSPCGSLVLSVSRKDDPESLGLPGGKQDPGETLVQTLVRELEEECGIEVKQAYRRHHGTSSSGKFVNVTFQVTVYEGEPQQCEAGEVKWVKPERLADPKPQFSPYNRRLFEHLGYL